MTWHCVFKGAVGYGIVLLALEGTETFALSLHYCCTCFELPHSNCCCLKYILTRGGFAIS